MFINLFFGLFIRDQDFNYAYAIFCWLPVVSQYPVAVLLNLLFEYYIAITIDCV